MHSQVSDDRVPFNAPFEGAVDWLCSNVVAG